MNIATKLKHTSLNEVKIYKDDHFISFEAGSPLNKTQLEERKEGLPVFEPVSRKK